MTAMHVLLATLLAAVFVVHNSEARCLNKRSIDDATNLLRELIKVSRRHATPIRELTFGYYEVVCPIRRM